MAAWTPDQLGSALRAWWKADAITGLVDADPVSTWTDSTANAYALTGTLTTRPLYKTAIQNGLPVVRFDGSNDFLSIVSTLGISAQPLTVACVWKMANANQQAIFQSSLTNTAVYINAVGDLEMIAGTGRSTAITKGAWRNTLNIFNGASSLFSIDGTTSTPASPGTNSPTGTLYVGSANGGASYWLNGDMGELLFLNTSPSTDDRQKLEGYLAWKWGLTLASGHPYELVAPTVGSRSGLRYPLGDGLRQRSLR